MLRCIGLAGRGAGYVLSNPLVGAVLVHGGRIIGEGYHEYFGGPHAEVNCLAAVVPEDRELISKSTLYVSLEPCNHYGKTPPCTGLIIENKIPRVVIGCGDSFEKVNGTGVQTLQEAGIVTDIGVLYKECRRLNRRFFTFHEKMRPYVVLKWAQSSDGKISAGPGVQTKISNPASDRFVHKWRAEEAAIFAGKKTVATDNPKLTVRHRPGLQPVRITVDEALTLDHTLHIFNDEADTIIINRKKESVEGNVRFFRMRNQESFSEAFIRCMNDRGLTSVLVEGGAVMLNEFITAGLWDEARVITNTKLVLGAGLSAPVLQDAVLMYKSEIRSDVVSVFKNSRNDFL